MKFYSFLLLLIATLLWCSCGTKKIPNNAVYLYEGQLNLLNGYYEIVPYSSYYSDNYENLDHVFNLQIPLQVTYVELEFLSDKKLKVSYEIGGITEERILKGKHKHGGFYLEKNWGGVGVPPFIWANWNRGQRLFMGSDDNLILDKFSDQNTLLFGIQKKTHKREIYLYGRLYEKIYTGNSPNTNSALKD